MRTSIDQAIETFTTHLTFQGVRPATIRTHLARLCLFTTQNNLTHLEEITPALVAAWLSQQQQQSTQYSDHPSRRAISRPLSPATISARLLSLRYFLRICVTAGLLPADPLARFPSPRQRTRRRQNKAMSPDTAVTLLRHAQSQAATGDPLAIRDYALLAFLLDTGVRIGEAVSLRADGLDLVRHTARVNGKTGPRLVEYSPACAAALTAWLDCPTDYAMPHCPSRMTVFIALGNRSTGQPLTENAARLILKKLAAAAGVSGPVNPHSIRHLVGQRWVDLTNPALAQEKLGHANIKTTLGFYYSPDRHKLAEETDRLSLLAD